MQVALAQIACAPGEVATNLQKIGSFAEQAKSAGAELVVFPELSDTGYDLVRIREVARTWEEGAVPVLRAMAKRLSLAVICGVAERVGGSIYNSQVFIDAAGEVASCNRKRTSFAARRNASRPARS